MLFHRTRFKLVRLEDFLVIALEVDEIIVRLHGCFRNRIGIGSGVSSKSAPKAKPLQRSFERRGGEAKRIPVSPL